MKFFDSKNAKELMQFNLKFEQTLITLQENGISSNVNVIIIYR